jgi:glyoxylase-like metal-dependent hydrolase (beta-lactamase superfamily II)
MQVADYSLQCHLQCQGAKKQNFPDDLSAGDTVNLGGVTLTAHKTAGHSRGCTTWTMRSHLPGEPAETMRNIVIVGGAQ